MLKKDEKIFLQRFGKRISELREKQELTKVQLAFEIDTSESNIRRIEKGEINVGLVTVRKLALALNVSINELLDF